MSGRGVVSALVWTLVIVQYQLTALIGNYRNAMNFLLHYSFVLLLPTVIVVHLLYSPFTKVEESFNIQAIHDILYYGIPFTDAQWANYDHVTFSGSVPRTFVGALFVAGLSQPWTSWVTSPDQVQALVRGILGLGNALALLSFWIAVNQAFGRTAGYWTLPNMFAFGLTTVALRTILLSKFGSRARREKRSRLALYLLTLAGVIFRSEIAILLATHVVSFATIQRMSIKRVILPAGITAMTIGLILTVVIDSFFWQRFPLWPEWIAFRYNTIEGKSAEWGTSPWHFYFSNSIPRLILNPMSLLICIPVALSTKTIQKFSFDFLAPLLAFVAIYSVLPHKEWRFIIYIIPGLTAVAAAGAARMWSLRSKSILHRLLSLALVGSTVASFAISMGLLGISTLNYPGAVALSRLHEIADGSKSHLNVHLDNLSCQTGITRFLQLAPDSSPFPGRNKTVWNYDKIDDPEQLLTPAFWQRFDYVLAENPEQVIGKWVILEEVMAFVGFGFIDTTNESRNLSTCLPRITNSSKLSHRKHTFWREIEIWTRSNLTKGRWISVNVEPKIRILKRQR